MANELNDIMKEIGEVQEGISTPSDQKALAAIYDEPPASITVFPCFVNLEEETTYEPVSGSRIYTDLIMMHLLFARSDAKYSVRQRRLWREPVIAAFENIDNQALGGEAQGSQITAITYEPFEWNDSGYIAMTFHLQVITEKAL